MSKMLDCDNLQPSKHRKQTTAFLFYFIKHLFKCLLYPPFVRMQFNVVHQTLPDYFEIIEDRVNTRGALVVVKHFNARGGRELHRNTRIKKIKELTSGLKLKRKIVYKIYKKWDPFLETYSLEEVFATKWQSWIYTHGCLAHQSVKSRAHLELSRLESLWPPQNSNNRTSIPVVEEQCKIPKTILQPTILRLWRHGSKMT